MTYVDAMVPKLVLVDAHRALIGRALPTRLEPRAPLIRGLTWTAALDWTKSRHCPASTAAYA